MRVLSFFLALPIRFYQRFVSPMLPATCRFSPTCSCYARDALELHGAFRGSWLALYRILRCHPLGGAGYDPVPPPKGGSPEPPTSQE